MIINTKNIKKRYGTQNGYFKTDFKCLFESFVLPTITSSGIGKLPEKNKLSTCFGDCDTIFNVKIPYTGDSQSYVSVNGYSYFNENNNLYRIDDIGNFSKLIFAFNISGLVIDEQTNDLYVIGQNEYNYLNNQTPSLSGTTGINTFSTNIKYSTFNKTINSVISVSSGATNNYIITYYSGSTNTNTISFSEKYLSSIVLNDILYILTIDGLVVYNVENFTREPDITFNFLDEKSTLLDINGELFIFNSVSVYKLNNNNIIKIFEIDSATYDNILYNQVVEAIYINYSDFVNVLNLKGELIAYFDDVNIVLFDNLNNYSLYNFINEDYLLITPIDYVKDIVGFENGGIAFSGATVPFEVNYTGGSTYSKVNLLLLNKQVDSFEQAQTIITTTGTTINNTLKLTNLPNNEYIFKSVFEFNSSLPYYSGATFTNYITNDPQYLEYNNYDKNSDLYLGYILQPPFIEFSGSDVNVLGAGESVQEIEEYSLTNANSITLKKVPNGNVLIYNNGVALSTDQYLVDSDGGITFYSPVSGDLSFVYLGGNLNKNMIIETIQLSGITTYSSTTPNDKIYLTGTPTSYVVRLDNNLIGQPILTLSGVTLSFNTDYYVFGVNKILIKNQSITTPRMLQISYQAQTGVNTNLNNKNISVSVNTIPYNENGFINFIITDQQDRVIHIENKNWIFGQTNYSFNYTFTKEGTYKYFCQNVYINTLINGNKIFTVLDTPKYFTTISSTIVNQITEIPTIAFEEPLTTEFVPTIIKNVINTIGNSTLEAEEFLIPEFVE